MTSIADPDFRFSALERWVLEFLAVPSAPELPDGSPESIRVFRAGTNFYTWSLIVWASRSALFLVPLVALTVLTPQVLRQAPGWAEILWTAFLGLAWVAFIVTATVTLLARRINFRLRWYVVTDRSLRIRSGVFRVSELTMTYGNIQEIRVSSGPLQLALGLVNVEVHAAGGGGGQTSGAHGERSGGGHVGRFQGVPNANEIRDLMTERLRQYRDGGLGDTPHHTTSGAGDPSTIAAAKAMLDEARSELLCRRVRLQPDLKPGAP